MGRQGGTALAFHPRVNPDPALQGGNSRPGQQRSSCPVARLILSLLVLLLIVQGATGIVLAGTDVYLPPLGGAMRQWVDAAEAVRAERKSEMAARSAAEP